MTSVNTFEGISQQDLLTAQQLGRGDLSRYLIALAAVRRGYTVCFETFVSSETKSFFGSKPNYTGRYLSVSDGKRTVYFDGTRGQDSFAQGNNVATNKDESGRIFHAKGVRTPRSIVVLPSEINKLSDFLRESVAETFIMKPSAGSLGQGVEINLSHQDVFEKLIGKTGKWIIQEMICGDEYRVYVCNKQAIATYQKHVPQVVGDGISSVKTLIERKNDSIAKGGATFNLIDTDQCEIHLRSNGKSLKHKPRFLETVILSEKNFSSGGEVTDATETVPEVVKEEAIKAVNAVGLPNAGVDVLYCKEGKLPYVLEVNPRANIHNHTFPRHGQGQGLSVPDSILNVYFPKRREAERFPNFPVDFVGITDALSSGLFRRVELVSPKADWICKAVKLPCSKDEALKIVEMLKLVCIFVNWHHRANGDNRIDAFFLKRGYKGFQETVRSNSISVVSKEVDRQLLA